MQPAARTPPIINAARRRAASVRELTISGRVQESARPPPTPHCRTPSDLRPPPPHPPPPQAPICKEKRRPQRPTRPPQPPGLSHVAKHHADHVPRWQRV